MFQGMQEMPQEEFEEYINNPKSDFEILRTPGGKYYYLNIDTLDSIIFTRFRTFFIEYQGSNLFQDSPYAKIPLIESITYFAIEVFGCDLIVRISHFIDCVYTAGDKDQKMQEYPGFEIRKSPCISGVKN